jgi:hypothetical protein
MVLEHEIGNHEKLEVAPVPDVKSKTQQVIDKIPTEKSELFKFEINWNLVDEVFKFISSTHCLLVSTTSLIAICNRGLGKK